MKVKYKGSFPLSSVQKSFAPDSNEEYELSEVDGKYLLNTFPNLFEVTEAKKETKAETKAEISPEKTEEEVPKKPLKK